MTAAVWVTDVNKDILYISVTTMIFVRATDRWEWGRSERLIRLAREGEVEHEALSVIVGGSDGACTLSIGYSTDPHDDCSGNSGA